MSIPEQVFYDRVLPIAYPSQMKIMRYYPSTGQGNIKPNDVVKFNITTNGFWDPSSTYINLTLELDSSYKDNDAIQLDGSASSLISELIISSKGVELERIQEYDQLANFLEDMNYSNEQRFTRDIMGMGSVIKYKSNNIIEKYGANVLNAAAFTTFAQNAIYGSFPWSPFTQASSYPDAHASKNLQLLQGYWDSTQNVFVGGSLIGAKLLGPHMLVLNNLMSKGKPYNAIHDNGGVTALNQGTHKAGFYQGLNYDLMQGCWEPILAKTIQTSGMVNGRIQFTKKEKINFCIPLYSGIFGCLMPPNAIKYIPMAAFSDLVFEFRINPYGVFTSGFQYLTVSGAEETNGSVAPSANHTLLQRLFTISKFEIVTEMLYFNPRVDQLVLDQLVSSTGIVLHSVSWMLGPIWNFQAGQTPSGTYQLHLGFESLKTLCITFLPNDYLTYPYIRKLFRITNSLTSIQFRIGSDLYPSLPIKGMSGTSGAYDPTSSDDNNNEYLIHLFKAFNKFNNVNEDCSINSFNFALNQRNWQPGRTDAFFDAAASPANIVNVTNAFAMNMVLENLQKGKCLYAIDLENLKEDRNVKSGLNTNENKPFEILLTSNSSYPYLAHGGVLSNQASTSMYIWCQYDLQIRITPNGISVQGK